MNQPSHQELLQTLFLQTFSPSNSFPTNQHMQPSAAAVAAAAKNLCPKIPALAKPLIRRPCDVFINHRGLETKRTISGLLFDHLSRIGLEAFLDSKNMKPGDRLFEHIDAGIRECKVGVAVFSPLYCKSYFCLHELALLMETKKRVIPIFYDVKPSQLRVKNNGTCSPENLQRFENALEEAKYTVGLAFDSRTGDWSGFLKEATEAVMENLREVEEEEEEAKSKNNNKNSFLHFAQDHCSESKIHGGQNVH